MDRVYTHGDRPLVCHSFTWRDDGSIPSERRYIRVSEQVFGCRCRLRVWLDVMVRYRKSRLLWIVRRLNSHRFAWVVIIATEVTAVAQLFQFCFDPKYLESVHYPPGHRVEWKSTLCVSPAVFVALWLIFILSVNLLRVRIYGEIEYGIGVVKMVFFVGLIVFNVINNARHKTYFKYYRQPYGFESKNFTSHSGNFTSHSGYCTCHPGNSTSHSGNSTSHSGVTHGGGPGHFAAMWTAMTVTVFSMIGWEAVVITAPENKDLETEESIKIATRKISLRIILLYTLSTFVVGLNVPYDDPQLSDTGMNAISNGARSSFVVAAVRDGVLGFPSLFNGIFIFSATSAGLNALYLSSRLLHALANVPAVWPSWSVAQSLRRRLEHTSESGVPRAAVFTSWLFGWLGMLAVGSDTARVC